MSDKINTTINDERDESDEREKPEDKPVDQCIDKEVRMRKYRGTIYPYIPLENNRLRLCV